MRLRRSAEKVEKILNEQIEDTEYDEAIAITDQKTTEFETFVTEMATAIETDPAFEDIEEAVVTEMKAVVTKAKDTGLKKTDGIKIATNIGKLKAAAKKELKVIQDTVTEQMLNLTTVEGTDEETAFATL